MFFVFLRAIFEWSSLYLDDNSTSLISKDYPKDGMTVFMGFAVVKRFNTSMRHRQHVKLRDLIARLHRF
jgi:hypothetical protein